MSRSAEVLLEDILESIRQVEQYTTGLSKETFSAQPMVQDAVIRRLEVIGEAVKGLPDELRDRHSGVPWRQIAGARDILIHEYFRVDLELTWQMVTTNLPELQVNVTRILQDLKRSSEEEERS
jgi:uncharacterized protein with HEPN domain